MPLSKPVSPLWQPGKATAGCKLYLPLAEGSGTTVRDYAGGLNGSFVGAPTWQRGLYGPQLGGFSSSNYVAIDPPAQLLYSGIYPCWMAVLCRFGTGGGHAFSQASTAGSNGTAFLALDGGGTNRPGFFVRNNAGSGIGISAPTAITDGLPHVLMGWSTAADSHSFAIDGALIGTSGTSVAGAFTSQTLSIGCSRRASVSAALNSSAVVLWAGLGTGSVPDPLALASDLLSGRFAAIRYQSNLALLAAMAGGSPPPFVGSPAAMMMGF